MINYFIELRNALKLFINFYHPLKCYENSKFNFKTANHIAITFIKNIRCYTFYCQFQNIQDKINLVSRVLG
jgi:hypothetical protein